MIKIVVIIAMVELFTLDWYSDEHKINRYTWGKTVLAVKPKLIEYGK